MPARKPSPPIQTACGSASASRKPCSPIHALSSSMSPLPVSTPPSATASSTCSLRSAATAPSFSPPISSTTSASSARAWPSSPPAGFSSKARRSMSSPHSTAASGAKSSPPTMNCARLNPSSTSSVPISSAANTPSASTRKPIPAKASVRSIPASKTSTSCNSPNKASSQPSTKSPPEDPMRQFFEFCSFELKFRAKSVSTWVYFAVWFTYAFLCVASESFGPIGFNNGKVLLNSAFSNAFNDLGASLFGVIIIAAIFGTSMLRDFQRDMYQILFTKPISKFAYLGGRWTGSFLTTVFVFSGLLFGTWLGTLAPWADHTRIGPNHLWAYLQPFFSIVVVQIFFLGSAFFAIAALTRKIFIVYLQGVALFMLYVIGITVFSATRSLERFWSGILDPVGFILFDDLTRYWTVVEKNTLYITWSPALVNGIFLYNRLLWLAVGFLVLAALWMLFPMSAEALTARSQGRRAAKAKQQDLAESKPVRSLVAARLPLIHQAFSSSSTLAQYLSLSRLRIRNILRDVPFWAILALIIAFAVNNGHFAGHVADRNVWPVTYLMLQAVEGSATLFLYIVAALYAAELLWRERDTRFAGIHDALPMRESTDWRARFSAVVVVELILLTATMLIGIFMQTIAGYYHYELLQYFKELYLVTFPQVLTFTLLAFFVQTLVSNKFLGHGIIIGLFVLMPILFNFGWENTLYLIGQVPAYTYSDMNGYGHFVPALFWAIVYWLSIAAFLGVVSIAYARRGGEDSLRPRTRLALARAPRLAPVAALFLLLALGSGSWYYYNAHVLNEYRNARIRRDIQADYERQFKKFENALQPKITAVDADINIYPARRSFDGAVRLTLQNKFPQPIDRIYLTDQHQS